MTYDLGVIKRQRYVPSGIGTGGTISNYVSSGTNYTAHIFNSSGIFFALTAGTVEYLAVAGGGGGGSTVGGGGGAGGYRTATSYSVAAGDVVTVTIGGGGAGGTSGLQGTNGGATVFGSITSAGGGGGGMWPYGTGKIGASGGGGAGSDGQTGPAGTASPAGQGNAGGVGAGNRLGGGGGGAGGIGGAGGAVSLTTGVGGIGLQTLISGTATYYAGGGSGGSDGNTIGAAGAGGGGIGAKAATTAGTAGTTNTGGGGGGGGNGALLAGLAGGSGIVIIRYPSPANAQLFNDPYFNSTSLLLTGRSEAYPSSVDYLVVAGGGGGGSDVGGGGGAGGLIQVQEFAAQPKTSYTVTVGAGGIADGTVNTGGAGGNSAFSTTTASGGGGGANQSRAGAAGGSGGGGGWFGGNNAGGAGIAGQGNAGAPSTGAYYAGGGGGAGSASTSAEGGTGVEWPTSSGIFYAKGGGGGYSSTAGASAAANTGNGGSGGTYGGGGGNGGSGVVIIRYAATAMSAITTGSPTIEIKNGYRYYTFKTSGTIKWGKDNTFIDSSYNALTVTPAGTPTQGSFSPFGQNWSTYFNGSNYLSIPDNAAFQLGAGNFTIEMWINPNSIGSWWLLGKGDGATAAGTAFSLYHGATWDFYYGSSTLSIAKPTLDVGVWQHIAVVRNTTTITIYKNGAPVSTGTIGTNSINTGGANPLTIGQYSAAGLPGYISNLRIVKGTAVYTANFTPPTSPLTVISNTALLTCASNRFLDKSGTTSTITAVGSPSVRPLAPFRGNDYNAVVQGGSGFFNGTSDYLSLSYNSAFNLGTGSFTWEAWIYPTNISGIDGIYSTSGGSGANPKFVIHLNAGTPSIHYNNLTGGSDIYTAATSAVVVNTWSHLAFVRNGSTWTWYINGVSAGTGSNSTNITFTTQSTYIGYGGESYFTVFNGYISNLRIIKGTAVYTANFTPSAAPVTALNTSSSTSLLLNFTNAGIIDYTAQNDLISINTATLSTSIVKYNTQSVKVNGIADYLALPATSDAFVFRTGDFTVEYWVYYNALPASVTVICGNATGAAGLAFGASSTAKLHMFSNTTAYTSTGATLVTGQWYHVAFVRQSGSVKYYLNGALDYTVAVATDITELTGSIGAKTGGTLYSNCYIDDLRVTKGVARYTAAFPAPLGTPQLK